MEFKGIGILKCMGIEAARDFNGQESQLLFEEYVTVDIIMGP